MFLVEQIPIIWVEMMQVLGFDKIREEYLKAVPVFGLWRLHFADRLPNSFFFRSISNAERRIASCRISSSFSLISGRIEPSEKPSIGGFGSGAVTDSFSLLVIVLVSFLETSFCIAYTRNCHQVMVVIWDNKNLFLVIKTLFLVIKTLFLVIKTLFLVTNVGKASI